MIFSIGQVFEQELENEEAVDIALSALRSGERHAIKAVGNFGLERYATARVLSVEQHEQTIDVDTFSTGKREVQGLSRFTAKMIIVDLPSDKDLPSQDGGK